MVETANGMHIRISQTLAFPYLECVLSTMFPTIRSEIPSKTLDTAMIVAMIPASRNAAFVK